MKKLLIVCSSSTGFTAKARLLAVLLLAGALAAASPAGAAAPWYGPGGPGKPGGGAGPSSTGERGYERSRSRYGEKRFVRYLYQGFLNREPESDEVRFWTDQLGRSANPTELVQHFMNSDEFFVRQTYIGLLGREPDARGMDGYMEALRRGRSRAEVVEMFLTSPEFNNRLR